MREIVGRAICMKGRRASCNLPEMRGDEGGTRGASTKWQLMVRQRYPGFISRNTEIFRKNRLFAITMI
jgi:hypothetical protein